MSSQKLTIVVLGARSAGGLSSDCELPRTLPIAGKSSLINRYCEGKFADSYFPTIDCSYLTNITVNNITYECRIIDTAGQDESFILKKNTYMVLTYTFWYIPSPPRDPSTSSEYFMMTFYDFTAYQYRACVKTE
ncbi:hypothetical protein B0H13DRAFT_2501013 [Mycena leptocephala]|nr:hypothetical protein B0H13DRAFT_2501013 [Mycena leptocephala]